MTRAFLVGAVIALTTAACSSDSGSGDGGGSGAAAGGASGGSGNSAGMGGTATDGGMATNAGAPSNSSDAVVGTFTVMLNDKQSSTTVSGVVRDAPPIELVAYVPDQKSGDCQLYLPTVPFCDPPCPSGQACRAGNVCAPQPTSHSVGTVTVRGLALEDGTNEFTMDPIGSSKAYSPSASVKLKYPPAAPGAPIELSTSGGDYAPFTIQTTGIAPIEGFDGDPLPLERDRPLELTWTAQPGAEVEVILEIAHHGGAKGKVICNAEDSGSLVIPASLVTELIGLGVAGYPDVTLTRKTVGSTQLPPGRVEFIMFNTQSRPVAIEGLTSCMADEDCPDGQVCGQDKACKAP